MNNPVINKNQIKFKESAYERYLIEKQKFQEFKKKQEQLYDTQLDTEQNDKIEKNPIIYPKRSISQHNVVEVLDNKQTYINKITSLYSSSKQNKQEKQIVYHTQNDLEPEKNNQMRYHHRKQSSGDPSTYIFTDNKQHKVDTLIGLYLNKDQINKKTSLYDQVPTTTTTVTTQKSIKTDKDIFLEKAMEEIKFVPRRKESSSNQKPKYQPIFTVKQKEQIQYKVYEKLNESNNEKTKKQATPEKSPINNLKYISSSDTDDEFLSKIKKSRKDSDSDLTPKVDKDEFRIRDQSPKFGKSEQDQETFTLKCNKILDSKVIKKSESFMESKNDYPITPTSDYSKNRSITPKNMIIQNKEYKQDQYQVYQQNNKAKVQYTPRYKINNLENQEKFEQKEQKSEIVQKDQANEVSQKSKKYQYMYKSSNKQIEDQYNIQKILQKNKSEISLPNNNSIQLSQGKKWSLNDFKIISKIGSGQFAKVYQAIDKKSRMLVALKVIDISKMDKELKEMIIKEIQIHSFCRHFNILELYGTFVEKNQIILILELIPDGTLFAHLSQVKRLKEKEAASVLFQIGNAIKYLHDNGIVHRDLKPENILDIYLLSDFGVSTHIKNQNLRNTFCGTLDYASPEILNGDHYNYSVDIWALGILTYEICSGLTPFKSQNSISEKKKLFDIDLQYPRYFSEELKDFISGILRKDPKNRITINQLLEHKWIKYNVHSKQS